MNPDGVSYLDIGDAYWRGDWHNAINAYWSPLYSWILGFFLNVLKPSMYWEYPLVHLVNFLIYAATLACFEFFLISFLEFRESRNSGSVGSGTWAGLATCTFWVLGYALFICSSLVVGSLGLVTPDLCVAAVVFLASGIILKICESPADTWKHMALGSVLGIGYLAKSVMFPLAFVYLFTAFFASRVTRKSVTTAALALAAFLVTSGPFLALLWYEKGKFTFGDAGSWNYATYVNHVDLWAHAPGLKHPAQEISSSPRAFEFAEPLEGTYPPWYEPSYFRDGMRARPTIMGELQPIRLAVSLYANVFLVWFMNVCMGACILYFTSGAVATSIRRALNAWPIFVPSLATLALYALVHVETRFISAQFVLLFLVLYSGTTFPALAARIKLATFTALAVAATSAAPVAVSMFADRAKAGGPLFSEAAIALQSRGVHAGDKVGLVWPEKWESGFATGAFVPRLLRTKIVAEVTDPDSFWQADESVRTMLMSKIGQSGAKAVLTVGVPPALRADWTQLGNTPYFLCTLR